MPRSDFSDNDLRRLHSFLQTAALAAYPNPKRTGCPGLDILKQIALAPVPSGHPAYEHVAICSPCLKEMLELQGENIRARKANVRKRIRWIAALGTAAAAVVAVALFLTLRGIHSPALQEHQIASNVSHPHQPIVGVIDFHNDMAARGLDQRNAEERKAARSKGEIIIVLPNGSEPGQYLVRISSASSVDKPIATYVGKTVADAGGAMRLRTDVDFSSFPPGPYVAAWQRRGATSWQIGSFTIR